MAITLEERPKGTCHFGVFHISLGSTLCTESELKSDGTVGGLPSSDTFSSNTVRYTLANQSSSINKYYLIYSIDHHFDGHWNVQSA